MLFPAAQRLRSTRACNLTPQTVTLFVPKSPPACYAVDAGVRHTMALTFTDEIWNRAALEAGGIAPGEGDSALADLLVVHGMIMNGGIDHALNVVSEEDYYNGMLGYRYFNFSNVVNLLEKARNVPESELENIDEDYENIVTDDDVLVRAFKSKINLSPNDFSPLVKSNA